MNENLSKAISFLRFPLILGIIFIHNSYSIHEVNRYKSLGYEIYHLICSFGSGVFPSVCVPTFFFISGFLFFNGVSSFTINQYREKLRKRFFSLFIPYLLWNVVPVIIILVKAIYSGYFLEFESKRNIIGFFWDYKDGGSLINVFGWNVPIAYPINGPLWYVRDLILMCILSPVVYWIVRFFKLFGIFIFALIYIFSIWPNTIFLMLANSLCFFSLGSYFSILRKRLYNERIAIVLFLLWVIILITVYVFHFAPQVNNIIVRAANVLGVFAIINFATYVLSGIHFSWPKLFVESVFFVYAAHTIYINGIVGVYFLPSLIPGDHYALLILKYLLSPLFVWGICLAFYYILKKWAPFLLFYMNGGR